jgi:hypothetical protein
VRAFQVSALLFVLVSEARPATGEPRVVRSESDGQSYREYQAQLQQILAAERPSGPAREVAIQPVATAQSQSVTNCKLFQVAPERVPAQECMSCHGMHTTHPVEIDYEAARYQGRSDLRPAADVVRKGVFLPGGKVACVTCHDPASRWAYHLAIPPGAQVRPSVNPHDPSTYERPVPLSQPQALAVGTSVSPTPLCRACHTIGE